MALKELVRPQLWRRWSSLSEMKPFTVLTHFFPYSSAATAISKDDSFRIQDLKPSSLGLQKGSPLWAEDPEPRGWQGFALKMLGFYSRQSKFIRQAKRLYTRIQERVADPQLYTTFGLERSFKTTHAMLVIHMWLCLVRLRAEGKPGTQVGQYLYDIFNHDLEQRVVAEGVKMLLSKWMKELEKNFYGAISAYDKAMQPDAEEDELTAALWRNVFSEDGSSMPSGPASSPIQALSRYIKREAACLSVTDSDSILTGNISFSSTEIFSNTAS